MSNSFCNEETLNPFIYVNKSESKNACFYGPFMKSAKKPIKIAHWPLKLS